MISKSLQQLYGVIGQSVEYDLLDLESSTCPDQIFIRVHVDDKDAFEESVVSGIIEASASDLQVEDITGKAECGFRIVSKGYSLMSLT